MGFHLSEKGFVSYILHGCCSIGDQKSDRAFPPTKTLFHALYSWKVDRSLSPSPTARGEVFTVLCYSPDEAVRQLQLPFLVAPTLTSCLFLWKEGYFPTSLSDGKGFSSLFPLPTTFHSSLCYVHRKRPPFSAFSGSTTVISLLSWAVQCVLTVLYMHMSSSSHFSSSREACIDLLLYISDGVGRLFLAAILARIGDVGGGQEWKDGRREPLFSPSLHTQAFTRERAMSGRRGVGVRRRSRRKRGRMI